jgi:hypothetical protein
MATAPGLGILVHDGAIPANRGSGDSSQGIRMAQVTVAPAIVKAIMLSLHMHAAAAWLCGETGGGIVTMPDGTLRDAPYIQVIESDPTHLRMVLELPAHSKLAAIWHTHTQCYESGPSDDSPSVGDIKMQKQLGVPSFIFVQRSHNVWALVNGRTVKVGDMY